MNPILKSEVVKDHISVKNLDYFSSTYVYSWSILFIYVTIQIMTCGQLETSLIFVHMPENQVPKSNVKLLLCKMD